MAHSLCVVASSVSRDRLFGLCQRERDVAVASTKTRFSPARLLAQEHSMLNVVYLHQGGKQCSDVCSEALWIQANSVSSELLENATECLPVTINHGLFISCLEMQAERILINQRRFYYNRSKFSAF